MEATAEKHEMRVLDRTGDTKIKWDPAYPEEVKNARKTFDDMRKKGYMAYSVDKKDAGKGELLTKFDPAVKAMILSPRQAGG